MLYDDVNQVEVRYVISLAHHNVSIFGGEKEIPEGELWIKRNAVCLSRRLDSLADLGGPTPPFFLFSENLSEKEDFYFALLQNQAKMGYWADNPPKPQQFDIKDIVALARRLHSSEEQLQTRWINAVFGRLFLALYKTPKMEEYIRQKITKKISRVKKPNFVSHIGIQRIVMGEGAPFITNPRLKDLTVDGSCCVEADIEYSGNFRVEINATARIDLGARFKPREVDLVLAVVLKKFDGHGLLRFKPPPSNRCWFSFETTPHMVMDIEPIVSSKQITLGIVLRAIESRIREVVAESIVLPFWDDIPFLDTHSQPFRGGIWEREQSKTKPTEDPQPGLDKRPTTQGTNAEDSPVKIPEKREERPKSFSGVSGSANTLKSRVASSKSSIRDLRGSGDAISSAFDKVGGGVPLSPGMRSRTFCNTADPIVTADTAKVNKVRESKPEEKSSATSAMVEISNRSPPTSPSKPPNSPSTEVPVVSTSAPESSASSISESVNITGDNNKAFQRPLFAHVRTEPVFLEDAKGHSSPPNAREKLEQHRTSDSLGRSINASSAPEERTLTSRSIGTATAVAKKWGWNMFGKSENSSNASLTNLGGLEDSGIPGTPENPIGRGHPLPPPGTPLPTPEKFSMKGNAMVKRKPLPAQLSAEDVRASPKQTASSLSPIAARKPVDNSERVDNSEHPEADLLVVKAPHDSGPNSPATTHMSENADADSRPSVEEPSTLKDDGADGGGHVSSKHDPADDKDDLEPEPYATGNKAETEDMEDAAILSQESIFSISR